MSDSINLSQNEFNTMPGVVIHGDPYRDTVHTVYVDRDDDVRVDYQQPIQTVVRPPPVQTVVGPTVSAVAPAEVRVQRSHVGSAVLTVVLTAVLASAGLACIALMIPHLASFDTTTPSTVVVPRYTPTFSSMFDSPLPSAGGSVVDLRQRRLGSGRKIQVVVPAGGTAHVKTNKRFPF